MDGILRSSDLENEFLHDVPTNMNADDLPLLLQYNQKMIRELTDRISKHQHAIAFLNGRSNVLLSKINNMLPVELLIDIFMHLVINWFDSCNHDPGSVTSPWITVAYVCRYWREITFSSPRLFSYIAIMQYEVSGNVYVRSEHHFQEWVQLSQGMPLHFYVSTQSPNRGERVYLWELLLPYLHRAKTLILRSPPPIIIAPWPNSPLLTFVDIDTENQREDLGGWVTDLIRAAPKLQTFECSTLSLLEGNDWEWMDCPIASSLTKLRIAHTAPYLSSKSLDDLLVTLRDLPRLRELDLSLLTPGDYAASEPTSTQKSSYHIDIENLKLNGHWLPVFGILNRVTSVDKISIEITKSQRDRDSKVVRSLPRALVSKLRKGTAPYRTLRLSTLRSSPLYYHHNDWKFVLEGWSSEESSKYLTSISKLDPDFRMAFILDEVVSDMGDRCATIGSMLDDIHHLISQAGTLLIATDITDDLSQALVPLWLTVLSRLQVAHSIHITFAIAKRYNPQDILGISPRLDTFIAEEGGGPNWFSHLRRLRVTVESDAGSEWFMPQMLPSFRRELRRRWEQERAIDILLVEGDTGNAHADVQLLADFVSELQIL